MNCTWGSGGPTLLPTPPYSPISRKRTGENDSKAEPRLSSYDSLLHILDPIDLPHQCFSVAFPSWPKRSALENEDERRPENQRLTLRDCMNDRGLVKDGALLDKREKIGRPGLILAWSKHNVPYQSGRMKLPKNSDVAVVLPPALSRRHPESLERQAAVSSKQQIQRLQRPKAPGEVVEPRDSMFIKTAPPMLKTESLLTIVSEATPVPIKLLKVAEEAHSRAVNKSPSRSERGDDSQIRETNPDNIEEGQSTSTGEEDFASAQSDHNNTSRGASIDATARTQGSRGLDVDPSDRPEVHIGR